MRKAIREMKNVVYQFNEIELKVREATNNDRFMVPNTQLAAIARATNDYQDYPSLFAMLWKRLTDLEHVMHVTKALHVCEYLLRHGAERFINDAKRRARDIAALQKYKHYDEQNQDDAKEARARAKAVYALLMDDQLLAQERGKSARLASEGRLGGHYNDPGTNYDEDAFDEDRSSTPPPPVRRAQPASSPVGQGSSNVTSSGSKPPRAKSRAAAANDEDDPFSNPVIPEETTSSPPPRRTAPAAAATATTKPKKTAEVDAADEEEDEAARKAAKKAKKKAKKEAEARAALEAEQKAGAPAPPVTKQGSSRELDLMASYGGDLSSNGPNQGGEVDILTGQTLNDFGVASGSGGSGDLSELFAGASLHDEQPSPLFFQQHQHQPDPFQDDQEGYPSQSHSQHPSHSHSSHSHRSNAASAAGNSDFHSPTGGLVNLNDILGPAPIHSKSKESAVDGGVSMSMMRSIQPLGAPATKAQATPKKVSNVHSSIPLADNGPYAGAQQGFMPPPVGMLGGPPGGLPYGGMAAPYGYQTGMPPLGPPMGPYGAGYGAQPMMAIMPPGMNGGGYGQPQGAPYGAATNGGGLPMKSSSNNTFTQMRQAPKNANGAPIFDVVEAPAARPVEPTNYLGHGAPTNGRQQPMQSEYRSYYGQANSAQQPRF